VFYSANNVFVVFSSKQGRNRGLGTKTIKDLAFSFYDMVLYIKMLDLEIIDHICALSFYLHLILTLLYSIDTVNK